MQTVPMEPPKRVTGIGGVFFKCKDPIFGDNEDGSGGVGAFDIAVADMMFVNGGVFTDTRIGVESVSF